MDGTVLTVFKSEVDESSNNSDISDHQPLARAAKNSAEITVKQEVTADSLEQNVIGDTRHLSKSLQCPAGQEQSAPKLYTVTMEPRLRASSAQFATPLKFMEKHGDLGRPPPGLQGRMRADQLWLILEKNLNSVNGGVQKTAEKWKKVWADWKAKTKKKALMIRRLANGTSGPCRPTLNTLEERVIAILGGTAGASVHVEAEDLGNDTPPNTTPSQRLSPAAFEVEESADVKIDLELDVDARAAAESPPRALAASPPRPARPPAPPAAALQALPKRRKRTGTPFDRATTEFVAVEQRRLRLDEARERNLHERETERLRLEARRLDLDRERNALLRDLADLAQAWMQRHDHAY